MCAWAVLTLLAVWSVTTNAAEDNYKQILGMSYQYYEGQMSGVLPSWNQLLYSKPGGWKKNAHLKDGSIIGKDLSGGYYDAGDYLKVSHPLAWGTSNLVLSMLEFKSAYVAAGQWDTAVRNIRWAADWLVKAHIKAGATPADNAFVGQLGDKADHHYFGRPEHATNERRVYIADSTTGGADLVGESAAAYAAAAVLFKSIGQTAYAATLFKHAQQAFTFAEAYPNTWKTPSGVFQAYSSYWPEGYMAHLAWAAAWMCKYDSSYCNKAAQWFQTASNVNNLKYGLGYDWDATLPGAAVLVLSLGLPSVAPAAKQYLEGYILQKWEDTSSKCPKPSYSTVCYTPKGLAYYSDWGTLRNTANIMFIAALMGKYGDNKQTHICWARSQARYITGATTNKSYVIGYGSNQPKRPHHRQSACAAKYSEPCGVHEGGTCCASEQGVGVGGCCDEPNFLNSHPAQIVLRGALVGGPDQSDSYPDIRNDYQRSEVAVDYNAGFTGAIAALMQFEAAGALADCSNAGPFPAPAPAAPAPPPSQQPGSPPASGGSCKKVESWQKCGGKDGSCATCGDASWQGHCCAAGSTCKRSNEWFWMCTPSTASLATAAVSAAVGIPADQLPAALDVLELSAPTAAAVGSAVEVTAALTRSGMPVVGAAVEFGFRASGSTGSTTDKDAGDITVAVQVLTDDAGIARAVIPAEVAGVAGDGAVVSAITPDGRAVGARGTIPVSAVETGIVWQ